MDRCGYICFMDSSGVITSSDDGEVTLAIGPDADDAVVVMLYTEDITKVIDGSVSSGIVALDVSDDNYVYLVDEDPYEVIHNYPWRKLSKS